MSQVILQFNTVEEFMEEVRQDNPAVVRACLLYTQKIPEPGTINIGAGAPSTRSMRAQYFNNQGHLVELMQFHGNLQDPVQMKAGDAMFEGFLAGMRDRNIVVRPGYYRFV